MHGWVKSFEVQPNGTSVVMTVHDPSEGQDVTVLVTHTELEIMLRARPTSITTVLPQTPTSE
jgi:hypothetical protein